METRQATTFGEVLRQQRVAADLTQEELAERAQMSVRGLSYLEKGARHPYRDTVRRLAAALALPEPERADFEAAARQHSLDAEEETRPGAPTLPAVSNTYAPLTAAAVPQLYISYAQADRPFVERLLGDLEARGVTVWSEDQGLPPGTPSWEQALRDAIRAAPLVLVVASPHTRASRYVPDELRVAELYRRPVCPVWVAGEEWMECIPLGWGGTQYLDARGDSYATALDEIVALVQGTAAGRARALHPTGTAVALAAPEVQAFLIADVRGFTRFTQEQGDAAAARLAARFAALVQEVLAGTHGRLLETRGDEVLVAFSSVRQALRTALSLQARFARETAVAPELPLRVGMGLDAGEAVAVAAGYRGMALNLAARLCAQARAGEILVSEALAHLAGAVEEWVYLKRGAVPLKGVDAPVPVLQVLPAGFVAVVAAPADRAVEERLLADLRAQGLGCWTAPSMPESAGNGEELLGLREELGACRAVVVVASPAARQAREVAAALRLAAQAQRPVIVVRAEGTEAQASLPLAGAPALSVDARGASYAAALPRISAALQELAVPSIVHVPPPLPEGGDGLLAVAPPRNPYKGLRVFREADAGDFFGRESLVDTLVENLRAYTAPGAARFLAVVGPSGSGKSSVVLAGLLPRLRGGALPGSAGWAYLDPLAPGAHPLEALAVTLNRALPGSSLSAVQADLDASARGLHLLARRLASQPQARVVLIVDQAEELFTLAADTEERRQFIDVLVTAATEPDGPLLALLTLRADFYDRPMSYLQLGRLVDAQSTAVLPMGVAELRAAIEGPAGLPEVGLQFEGELVGDLLYDVQGQAGALPLLQFTLDQLFERRNGHLLTEAAYRDLGGVRGALARQAEATYLGLASEDQRDLARALFLRLIALGATEQETTRRRVPAVELELSDPQRTALLRDVAEAFITARLLTTLEQGGMTQLEVSHEALIREWPRLSEWLRAAREDIRQQQAVSADAAEWERRHRPADYLYRGLALDEALAWAERSTASALEAAFLAAAVAAREQQDVAEHERQARELQMAQQAARANRRAATRLRMLAGVLAAGLLVAAGLAMVSIRSATIANNERSYALASAQAARRAQATAVAERDLDLSRQLATQAISHLDDRYDLALLLSTEATRAANTVEARSSVLAGVESRPAGLITFLQGHSRDIILLASSLDGKVLASASVDGVVRRWDVARRQPLGPSLEADPAAVMSATFSSDGTMLAAGHSDGTVWLWSLARRRPRGLPLKGDSTGVTSVAFSSDGRTLAAAHFDNTVQLWNIQRHRLRGLALIAYGAGDQLNALAFSVDGKLLATGTRGGIVEVWDVASQRPLSSLVASLTTGAVLSVVFSPDGKLLAFAGVDGAIRLWDVAHRHLIGVPLEGNTAAVTTLAFSSDGALLASGGADTLVRVWNVARRRLLVPPFASHSGAVDSVVFSPDGHVLFAGTEDGAIALWDVHRPLSQDQFVVGQAQGDRVASVAFSPNGRILASGSTDGTIQLWDIAHGYAMRSPLVGQPLVSVAFSPNSRLLASSGLYPEMQLWDATRRTLLSTVLLSQSGGGSLAVFSPDGRTFAAGNGDGTIQLWDLRRRQPLGPPLTGHKAQVMSLAYSHDGRILASGSADGTVRLWDIARRRLLGPPIYSTIGRVWTVAFSPDGKVLAFAGDGQTVQLWDVKRWRLLEPPLVGHAAGIDSVAFSPNGKMLASAGWDNTVRLWDVASGQPLGLPLQGHTARVTSIAFSPDGTLLASGSWDRTVLLSNVDIGSACRIANRNLTQQEWRQYLGDLPYHKTCPSVG